MGIVTDRDKVDLERARQLASEGKALRQRVLGRIRQRTYRERQEQA